MSGAPTAIARSRAALAGAVSAGLALASGELLAGLVTGAPSPLVAVGDLVIALQPPGAKQVVADLFGTNDKVALAVATVVVVLALGAAIGLVRRARVNLSLGLILALTGFGALAGLRDTETSLALAALSWGIQSILGVVALDLLLELARPRPATAFVAAPDPAVGRRRFLAWAGLLGLVAAVGGTAGRLLLDARADRVASTDLAIPEPVDPAPSLQPDAAAGVAGLTPFIVPAAEFYRIDTALTTPSVDVGSWNLRVHGMVNRELVLSFTDLVELPLIERHITIACVSNEVGGRLVGNATWGGVRLTDILELAGVQAGATQLVGRSVDGFTAGFPTAWVTERERDALVAVTMNGEPLPVAHGYPARLIVPGLYGYVSATKWLAEIELTTLEAFDGYWVPLGWAKEAPILTQSRIDVPAPGRSVATGPTPVAGVAWAPDRGIATVEVQVDDGPWRAATIIGEAGPASWVQWKLTWDATPGSHVLRVRATDGTGDVQTDRVTRPDPDGARGHHAITVQVA